MADPQTSVYPEPVFNSPWLIIYGQSLNQVINYLWQLTDQRSSIRHSKVVSCAPLDSVSTQNPAIIIYTDWLADGLEYVGGLSSLLQH
ncbi:MAG: hypothetical protein P8X79_01455 [Reinekea sp.]